jgi:4-hydroxybenzoate polyprenyltransferase
MLPVLRIVADVVSFRVRRLEMANLAGVVSILLALRLPWSDVLVRSAFALVLNVLAYLINDVVDLEQDLASGRAPAKTQFLADHRSHAHAAEALLGLVLVVVALVHEPWLLVPAVAGVTICWIYSAQLKRIAFADVIAMALWGAVMASVAVVPGDSLGWLLVAQLGWFSACFELIQVLRDQDSDREHGIETTAVRLGARRTEMLLRIAMLLAALYAVLALHRFIGLALLVAPLLPIDEDRSRYWNRVRFVFGATWLAILAWVYVRGAPHGLLT